MPKLNLRDLMQERQVAKDKYEELRDNNAGIEEVRDAHKAFMDLADKCEMEQTANERSLDAGTTVIASVKEEKSVRELPETEVEALYTPVFLKALRGKTLSSEDQEVYERIREIREVPTATPYLDSNVDENGGLIIPQDIQTKINEYKRAYPFDFQSLVTSETVAYRSGKRVFEKLADSTPFAEIDEWETIPEVEAPTFEQKDYSVKDYAGILPIPKRMLQDTDAALMNTVAKYIARKSLITRNAVILEKLNEVYPTKADLSDIDAIKDVLNVELDLAFVAGAKIVTNQDGFNYLDKLKNSDGEYLMQDDVTVGTGKSLLGKEVVTVPNRELPSEAGLAPVFVGDLKEVILFFDRGVYEIRGTDVGGKSFTRNSYDIRVIDRFGVESWDNAGAVAGTFNTAPAGV